MFQVVTARAYSDDPLGGLLSRVLAVCELDASPTHSRGSTQQRGTCTAVNWHACHLAELNQEELASTRFASKRRRRRAPHDCCQPVKRSGHPRAASARCRRPCLGALQSKTGTRADRTPAVCYGGLGSALTRGLSMPACLNIARARPGLFFMVLRVKCISSGSGAACCCRARVAHSAPHGAAAGCRKQSHCRNRRRIWQRRMYTSRARQPALAGRKSLRRMHIGAILLTRSNRACTNHQGIARGPFDERQEKRDEAELSAETGRLIMVFNQPTYARAERPALRGAHALVRRGRVEVTWPSRPSGSDSDAPIAPLRVRRGDGGVAWLAENVRRRLQRPRWGNNNMARLAAARCQQRQHDRARLPRGTSGTRHPRLRCKNLMKTAGALPGNARTAAARLAGWNCGVLHPCRVLKRSSAQRHGQSV
ncbi:hypothetical protein PHYSODRAFT_302691 [Phytophthora sojae]|uniref:Uncharacterized protein n=1 Tax=Phytophthora sojae (strain P6497) TaxID=1094619 RepID=G4ZT14_PHYSP|nr:hypothetical protein PHYSODRAFT_302691 [Phytophthora sojae]EGZ12831.1 hypothetical protein PHYSODRAFT_302691 [Phytophthora sojae]|eukprot:XP_009530260.1 hypothetical protein PHYSODRAFT_302691 [Phytophthora sojae]